MAEIFPFRALRYAPARVELARVVTQPYDKITPAMQESYYNASPYNLVRIILGKSNPSDGEGDNVYTRAADYLNSWRSQGILASTSIHSASLSQARTSRLSAVASSPPDAYTTTPRAWSFATSRLWPSPRVTA